MNSNKDNLKNNVDDSLLYKIIEERVGKAISKAEKRYHDTQAIKGMSEAELKPYRIFETNGDLFLIPKEDQGIPIESKHDISTLGTGFEGAKIYTAICGKEIIVKKE